MNRSPKPSCSPSYQTAASWNSRAASLPSLYRLHSPRIRCRACASTCSGSRVREGLASISLIRLQISTSQASATSGSAGPSKLATKSLANRALSVSVRARASDLKDSSCAVVIVYAPTAAILQIMHQPGIHNKSRQQGRFAPGPLNSGPCLKRYMSTCGVSYRGKNFHGSQVPSVRESECPHQSCIPTG